MCGYVKQFVINICQTGDFCKPCDCNGNINVSDTNACNSITGICQECLYHTYGDHCERCEDWYYGDAVNLLNNPDKNCKGKNFKYCIPYKR